MSRRILAMGALAAIALVFSAVSLAATKSITDPEGDSQTGAGNPTDVDITAATATQTGKKMVQTVTVKGKADVSSPPQLFVNKKPSDVSCDYFVGQGGSGIGVFKCSDTGPATKVGDAQIVATDDHTLSYTFKLKTVGSPSKFFWAFFFGAGDVSLDRAPDTGMVKQKVKSG